MTVSAVDRSHGYARDVVKGKIDVCQYVKRACQRQLDDLERFKDDDIFVFVPEAAEHICWFIEQLPHVKGPKAKSMAEGVERSRIYLEPWQCFLLATVFGWRRKDTGGRRFRRTYIEVPRGNAKSTISSGVALYCLALDGEQGADIYSAARTRDQARIVYGDAWDMLKRSPDIEGELGITKPRTRTTGGNIFHTASGSKFVPLSRESTNLDGLNIHVAVVDELHAHDKRDIYDVIETGTAKRNASLMWCITTAGSNTAGICYEVRTYAIKVLERVVEDESVFGIVYTLDDGDDWRIEKDLAKANPNWGVSVFPDQVMNLCRKAQAQASAQNNFVTKHCNLWVNADVQWMEMRAWDRMARPDMKPEDFEMCPLYIGLDLATKVDIAAKSRIFVKLFPKWAPCAEHDSPGRVECRECYSKKPGEPEEAHYFVFLTSYLNETAVEDGRNSQYQGWAIDEWLTKTPGDVTDFGVIKGEIFKDVKAFRMLRDVSYDPWQSAQLAQELEDKGIETNEARQTVAVMSAPMKEFESLVLTGRLHHTGDPVFRWMVSNVVAHLDAKENVFPRKQQPENKIDGVVASIMALGRALGEVDPYAKGGGFRTL